MGSRVSAPDACGDVEAVGGGMAQVLGLHGIAQEQKGRNQLLEEWRPGLADGVEMAAGRSMTVPSFDLCFYGDLFLPVSAQGERQPPGKGSAASDVLAASVSDDEADFLAEATAEVEAALPDRGAAMGAPRVTSMLQPLARRLTQRMDGRLVLQFLAVLRQVRAYLDDDALAERIRERFLAGFDGAPRVSEHAGDARPNTLIHLYVRDIDAVSSEFETPVDEGGLAGRECDLADPDGNRLRVAARRS